LTLKNRVAYGKKHSIACSSGTAAVHLALGALELPVGSEVITSSITDMGSLTGLLYPGLVPVFADADPDTLNMDPASVRRRRITPKTRHPGGASQRAGRGPGRLSGTRP